MKIDVTFFRSKVARRILVLFIVSALVPIVTLAILSFSQVTGYFNDQTQKHLHQAGKAVGMAIFERLLALEAELQMAGAYLRTSSRASMERAASSFSDRIKQRFTGIVLVTDGTNDFPLLGSLPHPPKLTSAERTHAASGKSALMTQHREDRPPRVFLATALDPDYPDRGTLIGEINTTYLWDVRYTLTLATELCVLGAQNLSLYCSRPGLNVAPAHAQDTMMRATSGPLSRKWGDEEYLLAFWSIFLEANFFTSKWTVIVGESTSYISTPIAEFKIIFPAVTVMAISLVLLLSIGQIRRSLVPLESLRDGTRKIANREFDSRVTVNSGDEFEELADSFNNMAIRLGRQFNVLSTMAEIDRLILSALDTKNIVKTVLLRMRDIVLCDFVSVTLVDAERSHVAQTLIAANADGELSSYQANITTAELETLHDNPGYLSIPSGAELPNYLSPLAQQGAQSFIALSIFLDNELCAIIAIGFSGEPVCSQEDLTQARRLADRVAVALSNASWEEKLYHQAHYDALTDLPNRVLLKDRLPQALVRAQRNGAQVAVLFIDLDRFKSINDSLGHAAGDLFLKEITHRLIHSMRSVDSIVRLGGDEFTIIVPDIGPDQDITANITRVADKVLAAIAQPFMLQGHEVSSTASIGIALYPRDAENYDELLKNADSAMYHAKEKGRGNYQFYSPDLNAAAVDRLDMENSLRHALESNQFELFYHPQIDLESGQIVGAEALLRWWHPDKGLILPTRFIPIAEHTGLIVPIGEWVLRTACAQNRAWRDAGYESVRVAVNLSARQFSDKRLVEKIRGILEETGLEPGGLALEVTETIVMEDIESTIKTLQELREMGLSVAIDDFGTGYSSLTYLKRFPISALKIDREFVRDITTDRHDAAIVASVIALGHSLDLEVVAEGVETEAQLEVLRSHRCDEFQGHLISVPVPAQKFEELMRTLQGDSAPSECAAVSAYRAR
ncbi:MAG: EAL domain-containing protein [Acidiferrobacterales bacterium]